MNSSNQNSPPVLIDKQAALEALDGSAELLSELAIIFQEDVPELLQQLETAINNDDVSEARRRIHSLKGLFATFFAQSSVEVAQRLEIELEHDRLANVREQGLELLEQHFVAILNNLREQEILP